MKKIYFLCAALCIVSWAAAQKNSKSKSAKNETPVPEIKYNCDSIVVNFETGLLNGKIGPDSPIDSIKKYLPCITYEIPVNSEDRACGGGAVMEKRGIFFNTQHGYIEFSPATTAKLPVNLFGITEEDLPFVFADPQLISDLRPYTDRPTQSVYLYSKSYGTLAIWVDQKDSLTFKVQLHSKQPGEVFLCVE